MDLKTIKKIVKVLKDNDLQEIEVEDKDSKIRVKRGDNEFLSYTQHPPVQYPHVTAPVNTGEPKAAVEVKPESKYTVITSPMVGTFYRSASPDTPVYVEEGQMVSKGQNLCIVEAMKLMNEIESDVKGKIISILVENGQPVEYGEALFEIDPS